MYKERGMADKDDQFEVLAALKRHFDREEFDKALPLCVKALQAQPEAVVLCRSRVFALLSLSRWEEALKVCKELASEQDAFAFEQAYCLYRLNRFQEALETLGAVGKAEAGTDRTKRLEAQVRYRMGDYTAAAQLYLALSKDDQEEVGFRVNAVAARVSGNAAEEALAVLQSAEAREMLETSYELSFNMACALLDEGRSAEAEVRLEAAKKLCLAELQADDAPEGEDDEDNEELAAIHVQLGCAKQRQGHAEEANRLYHKVLRLKGTAGEADPAVLAVANNNLISLRPDCKPLFDSLKRVAGNPKDSLELKLTRKQVLELSVNKCLLLLKARKMEDVRKELQKLKEEFPGNPQLAIVQAAMAFTEKKVKACEDALQAFLAESAGNEEVLVALAQFYAQQQRLDKASEVLDRLPIHRRAQPQAVEGLVLLHRRQKNLDRAVSVIREAIDYWVGREDSGEADEATLGEVLRIAARIGNELQDLALVAQVYQLLLEKVDGSDHQALCGLVQALASTDVTKAETYAQRLQVPSYDHLDPEELENAPIPKIALALRKQTEAEGAAAGSKDKKRRKRRKKIRYPKGFDPANPGPPPDPERWLPKRERTEFKKKMRKKDKHLLRGPQGSIPADDAAFRKQGPSTAQVEVSKDSSRRAQPRRKK